MSIRSRAGQNYDVRFGRDGDIFPLTRGGSPGIEEMADRLSFEPASVNCSLTLICSAAPSVARGFLVHRAIAETGVCAESENQGYRLCVEGADSDFTLPS